MEKHLQSVVTKLISSDTLNTCKQSGNFIIRNPLIRIPIVRNPAWSRRFWSKYSPVFPTEIVNTVYYYYYYCYYWILLNTEVIFCTVTNSISTSWNLSLEFPNYFLYVNYTTEFHLGGPDSLVIRTTPSPHIVRMIEGKFYSWKI
jgi:hypothetical protein